LIRLFLDLNHDALFESFTGEAWVNLVGGVIKQVDNTRDAITRNYPARRWVAVVERGMAALEVVRELLCGFLWREGCQLVV
jgi:hypothetical protein